MDVYARDNLFQRKAVIDKFFSVIWTERYKAPGDITLVAPIIPEIISAVPEGTFLTIEDSQEVMIAESVLIENDTIKITGPSLVDILNNRIFRQSNHSGDNFNLYYGFDDAVSPGNIMTDIVDWVANDGASGDVGLDEVRSAITNLTTSHTDTVVAPSNEPIANGPSLAEVQKIADKYNVGYKMTLTSVDPLADTYALLFTAYSGLDRTSAQTIRPVVRLSPNMDTLANVSQLRSINNYKTIVFAFAPDLADGTAVAPGIAYVPGGDTSTNFDRREMTIDVPDATLDNFATVGDIATYLQTKAQETLIANGYTKVVDGEIVPQSKYQFGREYHLGDLIELDSGYGVVEPALVSEYVRVQDEQGERAYPSVEVLD